MMIRMIIIIKHYGNNQTKILEKENFKFNKYVK